MGCTRKIRSLANKHAHVDTHTHTYTHTHMHMHTHTHTHSLSCSLSLSLAPSVSISLLMIMIMIMMMIIGYQSVLLTALKQPPSSPLTFVKNFLASHRRSFKVRNRFLSQSFNENCKKISKNTQISANFECSSHPCVCSDNYEIYMRSSPHLTE